METFKPQVKDISLFREIAQNIINPLEIIREAISNSNDAQAKIISIIVYRNMNDKFIIEIQDDGKGMGVSEIHRFFNLGDSDKNIIGIGEKGLGTKTYFKSQTITLITQTRDKEAYRVVMNKPWEMLSENKLPEYTIENIKSNTGRIGSTVILEGYIIDNPEKYFNFETIKDYILWYTAGGSFKTYFANYTELHKYVNNMQVAPRIFIEDKIVKRKEEISGVHQFYPPKENPQIDLKEPVYKKSVNYCRHFGPYHKATNINGEYVSFQMYGTISGINCRRKVSKLRQGESLKSRFGIYLAKDFIPFNKKINLLSDPNFHHYHLLINSQVFELTADRNNISNQDDPKVKWVFKEAKRIINNDIRPLSNNGYFNLRKKEEIEYAVKEKHKEIVKRLESYNIIDDLGLKEIPISKKPNNESQVALLFATMLANNKSKNLIKYIEKIGHYSHQSTTDMICIDCNNNKVLLEVEYKLSSLFKHEHPFETFDYVVCWSVDLDINEKKSLGDGNILCLIKENQEWMLKHGTQKIIPIIELKSIVDKLNKSYRISV